MLVTVGIVSLYIVTVLRTSQALRSIVAGVANLTTVISCLHVFFTVIYTLKNRSCPCLLRLFHGLNCKHNWFIAIRQVKLCHLAPQLRTGAFW